MQPFLPKPRSVSKGVGIVFGEIISGNFHLHAKKFIEGNRLYVSLVAREVITSHTGNKPSTRSREVYRDENEIMGANEYARGFEKSYQFELRVPDSNRGDFSNSTLGQALNVVGNLPNNERKHIE